ncbi:MAG: type II toxin-antitoxin system VapC family toxin [Bacteroidota bacterium]
MMPLFLADELSDPVEELVAQAVKGEIEIVSQSLFEYEILNALLSAKKRGRIPDADVKSSLDIFNVLPRTMPSLSNHDRMQIYQMAQVCNLSYYDASYLYLAAREKAILATLDKKLIRAAKEINIPLFE